MEAFTNLQVVLVWGLRWSLHCSSFCIWAAKVRAVLFFSGKVDWDPKLYVLECGSDTSSWDRLDARAHKCLRWPVLFFSLFKTKLSQVKASQVALVVKNLPPSESTCQCRWQKRRGLDPWIGKIPWRRTWQPTLIFFPGESHGQRGLAGYSPYVAESDRTEQLSMHASYLILNPVTSKLLPVTSWKLSDWPNVRLGFFL